MLVGRHNKVVKVVQTRQQEDNTNPSRQNKEEYLKTKALYQFDLNLAYSMICSRVLTPQQIRNKTILILLESVGILLVFVIRKYKQDLETDLSQ